MKLVEVPPVCLGRIGMDAALDRVFGTDTLRKVHGDDVKVSPFDSKGKRAFEFKIDVTNIPPAVRVFFCKPHLLIRTNQTLSKKTPQRWEITNKLKMHFVGAELFKIRPQFWLSEQDGEVCLGGKVRHDAVLPPPMSGICENFMALNTRMQLTKFAEVLASADPARHWDMLRKWNEGRFA